MRTRRMRMMMRDEDERRMIRMMRMRHEDEG
jgi:hypothetical protein